MRKILVLLAIPFFGFSQIGTIAEKTKNMELRKGFYDFYWDNTNGKIYLVVDKLNMPFLYVNSLPAGLGSNDIGLDRGQLGDSRIVYFNRVGKKLFLTQPNLDYRAVTKDKREQKAVEQSFAQSILFNFNLLWKVIYLFFMQNVIQIPDPRSRPGIAKLSIEFERLGIIQC